MSKHSAQFIALTIALSSFVPAIAADAPTPGQAKSANKRHLGFPFKKQIAARFFAQQPSDPSQLSYPPAPPAPPGQLVAPPGESPYYPVRKDGQPYVNSVDTRTNQTTTQNRFKYDPVWDGLVRSDFDSYSIIGRGQRSMSTWPESNEFSVYRVGTRINKMFERWMGFDPYEFR